MEDLFQDDVDENMLRQACEIEDLFQDEMKDLFQDEIEDLFQDDIDESMLLEACQMVETNRKHKNGNLESVDGALNTINW